MIFFLLINIFLITFWGLISLKKTNKIKTNDLNYIESKIDVLITSNEKWSILKNCLDRIISLNIVNKVIVALDHPSESIIMSIQSIDKRIVIAKNVGVKGKIITQKLGLKLCKTNTILIIDADIEIAINDIQFSEMLRYRKSQKIDILCAFTKGKTNGNFWSEIIEWDRIIRQRVLRKSRDYFDLSNISGYFSIVDLNKYKEIIEYKTQDDVIATINCLKKQIKIKTYPQIIGYELEKNNFWDILFQKSRWTYGNMALIPQYISASKKIGFVKGSLFLTVPYMWYFIHYLTFIVILHNIFYFSIIHFYLIILYFTLNIIFAFNQTTKDEKRKFFYLFLYVIIWPLLISFSLFISIFYKISSFDSLSRRR